LLLAGCGRVKSTSSVAYYDRAGAAGANCRIVASLRVDVFAVSGGSSAMQYRLLYSQSATAEYAESRWVAPPAELVGHALRKRMLSGAAGGACRLRVDLDEFAQIFDSASASRAVLEARVQLVAPTGGEILARHSFSLSRPSANADAGGGATALAGTVEALSTELHDWLGGLDRPGATGLNIAQRCKS
jgi:cholesterol transport system auxiliary component